MGLQNQQFDSFEEWNEKRAIWMRGSADAIFFDCQGRRCVSALDFKRAKDQGAYPVRWLLPEQVGSVALYSIGMRALKYHAEVALVDARARNGFVSDEVLLKIEKTLEAADRTGSPAGANALHLMMMQALLVDACFDTLSSFRSFFDDVATWKGEDGETWATLMQTKFAKLEETRATLTQIRSLQ